MTQLYQHQLKIITDDPKKTGLFLGTGSGKTLTALCLARGKTLVICPKTQKEDKNWERENEKNNLKVDLNTISKETFRRDWDSLPAFDTIILDESHFMLGIVPNIRYRNKQPIPKASQIFEAIADFIQKYPPQRLYLLTATITKSPFCVWGAAKLLGYDWNFYEFRNMFYVKLPMPGREVWMAKKDDKTKDNLARLVKHIGITGRLEDYFDVPEQTFRTIHIELTEKQKQRIKDMDIEFPEPIVRVGKICQIENGVLSGDEFNEPEIFENGKIEKILDLAVEFPKMIIFSRYRAQITQITLALEKMGKKVFTMTGDTKDRQKVLADVNNCDDYVFIVSCQISAGWEVPDCPVVVFASKNYSYTDFAQSIGRVQRANKIKKNLYISLVVKGGVDQAVEECIENKKDFDERLYFND